MKGNRKARLALLKFYKNGRRLHVACLDAELPMRSLATIYFGEEDLDILSQDIIETARCQNRLGQLFQVLSWDHPCDETRAVKKMVDEFLVEFQKSIDA